MTKYLLDTMSDEQLLELLEQVHALLKIRTGKNYVGSLIIDPECKFDEDFDE